jgi:predicted ATPase
LKVRGFKNLVDVDVRFGPFTCIAGANGVGKSNLFDAIFFLSALAEKPLLDAALSVRDETGRSGDVRSLFHRVGDEYSETMSFEAEMIAPLEGTDDLGQQAQAAITFLRYAITLSYRADNGTHPLGRLEVIHEDLSHVRKGEAHKNILFPHKVGTWRKTAVTGHGTGHRTAPFISTKGSGGARVIRIHQDGGSRGQARSLLSSNLPRTALSTVNAAEGPTATMARKEMQSWRLLQLEPSCLRRPDPFTAPAKLGADGSHLAATLYRLARSSGDPPHDAPSGEANAFAQVANRLSELIDDVRHVSVERDDRRELLTLCVTGKDGTIHPARALSDGTLRFLALAVLDLDPETTGLLCLEEPENGIHPDRIPAMLALLREIATDTEEPVGPDNPLRQVIINTHSPSVVAEMNDEDVLIAHLAEVVPPNGKPRYGSLLFGCVDGTWRSTMAQVRVVPKGVLQPYLRPLAFGAKPGHRPRSGPRRIADRRDLQVEFEFGETECRNSL